MLALPARLDGSITMTDRSSHPHFDDRGTLSWHTRYAAALEQARSERKTVFIEMGREL